VSLISGENAMRITAIGMAGLLCSLPCAVLAVPAELLNKSVTVSYTVTIPARGADGSNVPGVRNATRTIYISSAGRAFGRVNRRDGRQSETKEAAPGERANTLRFEGSKLVGVMPFVSGAAQMTISFQGGSSCDAAISVGRDQGKTLKWKGVNGMTYEATGPATVSNIRCSVSAGNAFAGE
jgi:hypothetical protein